MVKKEKEKGFQCDCFCNGVCNKCSVVLLGFGLLFIIVGTELVRLPPTVNGWSIFGLLLLVFGVLGLIKP